MFSCEFCEISKNIFFTEHLCTTASGKISKDLPVLDREFISNHEGIRYIGQIHSFQKQLFPDVFLDTFLKRFRSIHRESPVLESLFNKRPAALLKRDSNTDVFL